MIKKINKNSWHYKLVSWFELDYNKNLCHYRWTVFLSMFLTLCLIVTFLTMVYFLGSFILAFIPQLYIPFNSPQFIIGGGISLFFYGILLCYYFTNNENGKSLLYKVKSFFRQRKNGSCSRGYKKPDILIEYMKSTHKRVCPKIEFFDEE